MTIPREIESFCNSILLGMKYAGKTDDDWITYALRHTDQQQLEIVKRFLADVSAGDFDAVSFQHIWDDSASRLGLRVEGDVRGFLMMVRDRIVRVT